MPVTSKELLEAANRRAAQLNVKPLTPRILRDLVDCQVLVVGTHKGVKRGEPWQYPNEAILTVEGVVEFRSQGAIRSSQLKLCLWQFQTQYGFDILQAALKEEFGRFRKRQQREPPWWEYDHRDKHRVSERVIEKAKLRLPKLDGRLAIPGLTLSANALLQICSTAYWGKGAATEAILANALADLKLFGELPQPVLAVLSIFMSIEGTLGAPDEIGFNILNRITEEDLEFARVAIWVCYGILMGGQFLMKILRLPQNSAPVIALDAAAASFLRPDWIVPSLALFSMSHFNYRNLASSKVQ
jgi:hypothetical protein